MCYGEIKTERYRQTYLEKIYSIGCLTEFLVGRVMAGVQRTISRIFRRDCADCAEYRSSFLSRVISQYFFILHLSLDN